MVEIAEMRGHVDVCFLMKRVGLLGQCVLLYISQVLKDEFSHLIRNCSQKLGYV